MVIAGNVHPPVVGTMWSAKLKYRVASDLKVREMYLEGCSRAPSLLGLQETVNYSPFSTLF